MFRIGMTIVALICLTTVGLSSTVLAGPDGRSVEIKINQNRTNDQVETRALVRKDGHEIRVIRRGDDVHVRLDGEPVPEGQLLRRANWLAVLDDDGDEIEVIRLLPDGGVQVGSRIERDRDETRRRGMFGGGRAPGGGQPPGAGGPPSRPFVGGVGGGGRRPPSAIEPPRGRIGITMGAIDSALAAHLQLSRDEVIHITNVLEGAPAERAGLKQHDIILKIDGESPATQQRLRQIVREKQPGETITLTVLRAGERHEIEVKLGPSAAPRAPEAPRDGRWREFEFRGFGDWFDPNFDFDHEFGHWRLLGIDRNLRERVRELLSEEHMNELRERLFEEIERALEGVERTQPAREEARRLAERLVIPVREFLQRLDEDTEIGEVLRRGLGMEGLPHPALESVPGLEFHRGEQGELKRVILTPPETPRPPRRDGAALRQLEERLERIEEQLERLQRLIEQRVGRPE